MPVVTNKLGLTLFANQVNTHGGNATVHLFKNNFTPVYNSVSGDFTEADFDGYSAASVAVDTVTWDGSNHWAVLQYLQATFTKSAGSTVNTLYGWYMTLLDTDSAQKIVAHDVFSPAQTMANTGDQIKITPAINFEP